MFFFFFFDESLYKGNKGEWSEVYTHFKLLADGELHGADGKLNRIDSINYPIISILRQEKESGLFTYDIDRVNGQIIVSDSEGQSHSFDRRDFETKASELLQLIKTTKNKKGESLAFPEIGKFMNDIGMRYLKAKSADKSDIRMVVHDFHINSNKEYGYSIKSKLGGNSTLFNANKDGTNFLFKVKGELTATEIEAFNGIKLFKDKFAYLKEHGCTLEFNDVVNPTFNCNLTLIDSDLKRILAECLRVYYSHQANAMEDVGEIVSDANPCRYPEGCSIDFYAYKLKQFLIITALGMTANTPWNGQYQANGGYIVVKEDGDVVCFHFIDRNQLEDYLYCNTAFDTPSTSRHAFGDIFEMDGELWMKLNMQIRFIHDR